MIIVIFCFLALEDHFQLLSEDKEVNADIKFILTGPRAHIFKFESAPLGYEFRRLHWDHLTVIGLGVFVLLFFFIRIIFTNSLLLYCGKKRFVMGFRWGCMVYVI